VSRDGEIILKPRRASIAREGRGIFKLSRPLKDVDRIIREASIDCLLGDV